MLLHPPGLIRAGARRQEAAERRFAGCSPRAGAWLPAVIATSAPPVAYRANGPEVGPRGRLGRMLGRASSAQVRKLAQAGACEDGCYDGRRFQRSRFFWVPVFPILNPNFLGRLLFYSIRFDFFGYRLRERGPGVAFVPGARTRVPNLCTPPIHQPVSHSGLQRGHSEPIQLRPLRARRSSKQSTAADGGA